MRPCRLSREPRNALCPLIFLLWGTAGLLTHPALASPAAAPQSTLGAERALLGEETARPAPFFSAARVESGDAIPARSPLRVHPNNPRYFTDSSKRADGFLRTVYLTGSHTWANLIDRGPSEPPPTFDFDAYLEFLQRHNHNFIRLWTRHVSWYHGYGERELRASPLPWARTGPGNALDGKARFDLNQLYAPYFERLRARVLAARDRGIYVSVMLFGGRYECLDGWRGNPFHRENNINSIDGDPHQSGNGLKSHTLEISTINELQEIYIRKVLESLNDLDNVLFEISNEGHPSSADWQKHWVRFIQQYESSKPMQHPVGMTALYIEDANDNDPLIRASAAQWISPLTDAAGVRNIAAADGLKVSVLDSDHWFVKEIYHNPELGREWVWKAFCRGHHPILMEHLPPLSFVDRDYPLTPNDPGYTASRRAMGQTRQFAERINLSTMPPRNDLTSTTFCLANPGREYLIYQPEPGAQFTVELEAGVYQLEWFNPAKGLSAGNNRLRVPGGAQRFQAPFSADAVLYLCRAE